jgi:threonine/homoserine/homoserine lactone efflux protein
MASAVPFLISGIVFGLSGGLSPGPLLTLVISETLKHGIIEGIKVAIAPLLTDLPIVAVTLFIFTRLASMRPILGIVSLLGAAFLIYLGYESLSFKGADVDLKQIGPQSIRKGVITNFLNPSPYMFWFTIGAPLVLKASKVSTIAVLLFILFFYLLLVGSKIMVAVGVGKSRTLLKGKRYVFTVRFLGMILLVFAGFFLRDGLVFLGLI